MSGLLAGKVWQSALDPRLKPLAAALADIANDDGSSIYPSVAYLAWLLGDDVEPSASPRMERTVQRGIKELRRLGVLVHVGYRRHNHRTMVAGRGSTPEYCLIEGRLPARTPWREKGDILSPMLERVTNEAQKGDKTDPERVTDFPERVTKTARMGDTGVTRSVLNRPDPSIEPSDPPGARAREGVSGGSFSIPAKAESPGAR